MHDQSGTGAGLFGDLVRPLLPALQRFMKRELSYLRARGDLAPDYPTLHDVVDEVLARAYQKLNQRPGKVAPQQWLHRIAQSVLAEEVSRRQAEEGRFISTESKTRETPDETLDERDESIYEFYQPDEMLRLEDVTPAAEANPEQAASDAEMRRYVDRILAELPTKWRRALLLAEVDDVAPSAIAGQLDASEDEVKRWIDQANTYLRARLEEVGLGPPESGQPSPYLVPVAATSTPELVQVFNEITGGENKPAAGGSSRPAAPASPGAA
ncbi:MAG: hypothetical protein JWQ21_2586 [Herminiimonas sp.]|nr:hypothetical protein [Herminiimonas sp.]